MSPTVIYDRQLLEDHDVPFNFWLHTSASFVGRQTYTLKEHNHLFGARLTTLQHQDGEN
jgi:hypothetical protein